MRLGLRDGNPEEGGSAAERLLGGRGGRDYWEGGEGEIIGRGREGEIIGREGRVRLLGGEILLGGRGG